MPLGADVRISYFGVKLRSDYRAMADKSGMSQTTHGWVSGEQQKFMSRLGNWFRKSPMSQDEPPMNGEDGGPPMLSGGGEDPQDDQDQQPEQNDVAIEAEPRMTFLRPWAKRDNAMDNLQRGIGALSDLLASLRDNMEKQSQRQDELLSHLAGLPDALRAIPESTRVQSDAFIAIQGQIERQTEQQSKLGVALESMSGNTQTSATVLEQLRDNTARRDGELERVIKRQNTRFTTMLTIAIVLSIAALTAVSAFGYLGYEAMLKIK
jgi:hypothetical protein